MKIKTISTLVSIITLSAVTNLSWAAGTLAGVDIDNTASISYSVNGANQTPIASAPGVGNSTPGTAGIPTTFKVDKKIDLLVTTGGPANATPSATGQPITYVLTNEGNSTESFNLTPSGTVGGDQFDSSACTVTIPTTLPVSLAPDATQDVTVECTIPAASATVTNGATSIIDLLAEANGVSETAGADTAGSVDTVFADDVGTATDVAAGNAGVRNANHSATNTFTINTAQLTVAKTSAVISDPTGGANPKRIPGAVVRYTVTVSNAAVPAVTATGIQISDVIPTGLSGPTATSSGVTYSTCGFSGDGIGACNQAVGTVTSDSFDLAPGETALLTIDVTVN